MNHYKADIEYETETNIHTIPVVSFEVFTQHQYNVLLQDIEEIYVDNNHYGILISDTYNDFNDISISKETFDDLLEILKNNKDRVSAFGQKDRVVCDYCKHKVHKGNFCEQCGHKLTKEKQ